MRRLLLVRHAPTSATRSFAFPADEPVDERGLGAAAALQAAVPAKTEVLLGPALRCRQTAEAAGLDVATTEPALAECDFGSWTGRTLEEVNQADPDAAAAWMSDPAARPHGGETLEEVVARVGGWLDDQATLDDGAVAITHGGVVKAAVVHALAAPLSAFWRIDVAPLSITELHAHGKRWTVTRVNSVAGP